MTKNTQPESKDKAPTIRAVYSLKAGGMGATLSNGQLVRLNRAALRGRIPALGATLAPDQYESLFD